MAGKRKIIRNITLIAVSVIVIGVIVFMMVMRGEMGKMEPVKSGQVTDDVIAIQDQHVNLFLIKGEDGYIAVDAGQRQDHIEKELTSLKISPGDVNAVFLTHSDFDHIGGLELFSKADIYLSRDEEPLLNGTVKRFVISGNHLDCNYKTFSKNQIFEIDGLTVNCLATPGHTPGSTSYLINGRYLFCGDSMSFQDGKAGLFNRLFNMDSEIQRKSLQHISALEGVEIVFTAHYGYSTDFRQAMSEID